MIFASNSPSKRIFILLGPPGSGKGTQAKKLSEDLKLPHISTGDLFRENMVRGTPIGIKAKEYIQEGKLVPDEVVLQMLMDRVHQEDCKNGYLLDGFPRTTAQADRLAEIQESGTRLVVLSIEVPDDIIIRRASGRILCKQCGEIYHREFSPPKKEGICDKCGGNVYQRADDAIDVVSERLVVYHRQTKPLIEYYHQKQLLHSVDGNKSPDKVYADLIEILSND